MFEEQVPLSTHSSYKIGGKARYFFKAESAESLIKAVETAKKMRLPIFILGGGTNILFNESGWDGAVIQISFKDIVVDSGIVTAGAGLEIKNLLEFTAEKSLAGLEWAGGLPGTVGGAVRGNAGAFGGETKDRILEVTSLNISSGRPQIVKRTKDKCGFGYRTSVFKKKNKEIVLTAKFLLEKGDKKTIESEIAAKIDYRRERHPLEHPNVGSIFKNVDLKKINKKFRPAVKGIIKQDPFPIVPTAFLISETGLKGVSCGGAMVSPKHPNFIVNVLNARSNEVKELISLVKEKVKNKFDVRLEEEIEIQ